MKRRRGKKETLQGVRVPDTFQAVPPIARKSSRLVDRAKDAVTFATLLGVLWAAYVQITEPPSVIALNFQTPAPFALPFSVRAPGFFDMYDVRIDCLVEQAQYAKGTKLQNVLVTVEAPPIRLNREIPARYLCSLNRVLELNDTVESASIRINMHYKTLVMFPRLYSVPFAWDKDTSQWIEGMQVY